ncbi:MAG: pseudaminic acid cytidylyltransferase [Alphaproteobacteria bacterium]
MKRLCIIPARAGSKRIPGKNIKNFCGKPMVAHVIEAAQDSGLFDVLHVSTDSDEIASIAAEAGYKPDFMRPADLADDHASMMEVVKSVVDTYAAQGQVFDTVALLYATSPLLCPDDLKDACAQFESGNQDKALLAVTPFPAPIEQAFIIKDGSDDLRPDDEDGFAARTQDLKQACYDAGMFCFYSSAYIQNSQGAGDFTLFRGYKVPSWRVTDIDWPEDWEHAEKMYKALHS